MPIILDTDKKKVSIRLLVTAIYGLLLLGAATMIYPFMITVTSSMSGPFDYYRFSPVPRGFYSRTDRYARSLSRFFPDAPDEALFLDRPEHWTTWIAIGDDYAGIDTFAGKRLAVESDPATLERVQTIAADYAHFALDYPVEDSYCFYDQRDMAEYLRREFQAKFKEAHPEKAATLSGGELRQAALRLLNKEWGIPFKSFFDINMKREIRYPMHHASWEYPDTPKCEAFLRFKDAYRRMLFRPDAEEQWQTFWRERGQAGPAPWPVTRDDAATWDLFKEFVSRRAPASQTRPFTLKETWIKYLNRLKVKIKLGLEDVKKSFTVEEYNRLFGTEYENLYAIPFPVREETAPPLLKEVWLDFVYHYYPRRLIEIRVTPEVNAKYREFVGKRLGGAKWVDADAAGRKKLEARILENYNGLLETEYTRLEEITVPARGSGKLWQHFVVSLPREELILHSAEKAYQDYLLGKYENLETVNATYGWHLGRIEEAEIPFDEATQITFFQNEWNYFLYDIARNFGQVFEYLFFRGRAFLNTIILIVLTISATLTVNPLCAYALSRFRLRWTEQILLFLLATMAFPVAVRAIPGFLLMRDLGLLNSYPALVLPGLANGLSIFILKGFFDGLPRELYEAATIDGATELQMFVNVTLPLTLPIMAVQSLTAFIHAYNSWQWALLVCQDEDYWTLAVWLYQMQQTWAEYPYVMMAGFVLASIPTAIVFISCQKIILRGIVIPAMK